MKCFTFFPSQCNEINYKSFELNSVEKFSGFNIDNSMFYQNNYGKVEKIGVHPRFDYFILLYHPKKVIKVIKGFFSSYTRKSIFEVSKKYDLIYRYVLN